MLVSPSALPSYPHPSTPRVFNHGIYNAANYDAHHPERAAEMRRLGPLFTARVLPCTMPGDVVQVAPELERATLELREHLGEVGLSTGEIVLDLSPRVAADHPDHDISVYEFSGAAAELRPDPKRFAATQTFGNKNAFIDYAAHHGYPVQPTLMSYDGTLPEGYRALHYPVFVKAGDSALGVSTYKAETPAEAERFGGMVGQEFQIQEGVQDCYAFMNVQYQEEGAGAAHLITTEQRIEGDSTYVGTEYPAAHDTPEIVRTTQSLANLMIKEGLKETFNFDVALSPKGLVLIECNPRFSASTYPAIAAQRLGITEWSTQVVQTGLEDAADVALGDLAYDRQRGDGVIVINNSFLQHSGHLTLLLAGAPDARQELLEKAHETLKVPAQPANA